MNEHHFARPRNYQQPFNWWGYRASPERPLTITELISQGTLDDQLAAFLWVVMEERATIIVAATPQEAGKTTMLTALLDFLPEGIEQIYLRGWYERFEFLEEDRDPTATYLLSNEISSHLPIYMWGRGVRRMFEAASEGYGFGATVHAASAAEVIHMLENYPLEVPQQLLTEIDLVLTMTYRPGVKKPLRRVMRLELIENAGQVPAPRILASRDVIGTELQSSPGTLINALVRQFGMEREDATSRLARRSSALTKMVRSETFAPEDVHRAIKRFRSSASASRSSESGR
ncbi:MAG: type II secretion system protein E [Sphaerobacteraceae bacterium]|nr:MAG: type II secretion system protein E [Sphaerobacteraceae bacterium]